MGLGGDRSLGKCGRRMRRDSQLRKLSMAGQAAVFMFNVSSRVDSELLSETRYTCSFHIN